MKRIINIILFIILTVSLLAQEAQWQSLFNGKNLNGWKKLDGKAVYSVQDGTIVGVTTLNTPNTFLATTKRYSNFILEFEFKVDNDVNSGVQFRSDNAPDINQGRMHGYQFEIDPSSRAWTGGIYDEGRRGWLYPLTLNPLAQSAFKKDEFNKARIEAIGNSIRTWVNGIPCADIIDNLSPDGYIALQVHSISDKNMEGKKIYWKNIRICTNNPEKHKTEADGITQINCIPNTLTELELKDGWKLLWDGKTSEGWRGARLENFPQKGWTMNDGILTVHKYDGGESTNGGDIITKKKYKNFILKVDFKITKGANSGIKYFVDADLNKGEGSAIGCEFQILDDNNHPDAKLGVKGNRTLGSLYDLIPAPSNKPFIWNGFNTAMIIVNGNKVEHWLNNVKIVSYERNNQMWNALVAYSKYRDWPNFGNLTEGNILLQDHGDEVSFKNIKIKELP